MLCYNATEANIRPGRETNLITLNVTSACKKFQTHEISARIITFFTPTQWVRVFRGISHRVVWDQISDAPKTR
jgi:hypothetical protein